MTQLIWKMTLKCDIRRLNMVMELFDILPNIECVNCVSADALMDRELTPATAADIAEVSELYEMLAEDVRIDKQASYYRDDDDYWMQAWVRVPHDIM